MMSFVCSVGVIPTSRVVLGPVCVVVRWLYCLVDVFLLSVWVVLTALVVSGFGLFRGFWCRKVEGRLPRGSDCWGVVVCRVGSLWL